MNFDSVPFSDGHRGHDVEEHPEITCAEALRSTLGESLAHNVGTRRGQGADVPPVTALVRRWPGRLKEMRR